MKVTIYFGHHKVGSTALQSFLFRNQLELMDHGLLYPGVESESLAYTLSRLHSARNPDLDRQRQLGAARKGPAPMNAREPHNALAFQMLAQATEGKVPPWHAGLPSVGQMIRTIRLQAQFLRPEALVLCSEVMANFGLRHPDLINRIAGIVPQGAHQLYCVLRRPDEYLVSWHAQRLRFGDKVLSLSGGAARRYVSTLHFNYTSFLDPWVKHFDGAPVHVRNYADVLAAGGSVEDFFEETQLTLPPGLETARRANESMPSAAMEIARRGNEDLPREEADKLRHYLLTCRDHLKPVANKDVEMFGASLRAELREAFEPVHSYLSAHVGRPFFPDLEDMTRVRPIPEAEAVADLLRQIPHERLPSDAVRAFITTMTREHAA